MLSALSFDQFPVAYLALGYFIAASLGYTTLKTNPSPWFFPISLCLVLYMRLPILVYNRELNVDESQMLAQAITLLKDPVFWRSVDGTTSGPLPSYELAILGLLLGKFTYTTAHFGAVFNQLLSVFFFYQAFKNWFDLRVANLSVYPLILFYAFTQNENFVHYASELQPIALLAAILYVLSLKNLFTHPYYLPSIALGLLSVFVPFSKLQAVPLLAVCLGYYVYKVLQTKQWVALGVTALSGSLFLGMIGMGLYHYDALSTCITFYLIANLNYGSDASWLVKLVHLVDQYREGLDFFLILIPLFVAAFLATLTAKHRLNRELLLLALALLPFTLLAVSRTGSGYLHHLLFFVVPCTCLLGVLCDALLSPKNVLYPKPLTLAGATYGCLFVLIVLTYQRDHRLNPYESSATLNRDLPRPAFVQVIDRLKQPNDYLTVWGWNCQYYVITQLPQGVAENHTIRSAYGHAYQQCYRDRYLADLLRNKPTFFVDAVGRNSAWLVDQTLYRYECFPELKAFIDTHYTFIKAVDDTRIFIRSDAQRNLSAL